MRYEYLYRVQRWWGLCLWVLFWKSVFWCLPRLTLKYCYRFKEVIKERCCLLCWAWFYWKLWMFYLVLIPGKVQKLLVSNSNKIYEIWRFEIENCDNPNLKFHSCKNLLEYSNSLKELLLDTIIQTFNRGCYV